MKIPVSISRSNVVKAIGRIDKRKPRYPKKRESTKYNLYYRGRLYPPKYVLRATSASLVCTRCSDCQKGLFL